MDTFNNFVIPKPFPRNRSSSQANPDQNLTRIDASGGLFGHTAAADERCRLTSHNMVVVVESVARHCDDKSVIFPQMCVPLPAASSSHGQCAFLYFR